MPKLYVGVGDKARKTKRAYIGVNNVAQKIKKIYVGDDNNKAQLAYLNGEATLRLIGGYDQSTNIYVNNTKVETQYSIGHQNFISGKGYYKDYPLEFTEEENEIKLIPWNYGSTQRINGLITTDDAGETVEFPLYRTTQNMGYLYNTFYYHGVTIDDSDYSTYKLNDNAWHNGLEFDKNSSMSDAMINVLRIDFNGRQFNRYELTFEASGFDGSWASACQFYVKDRNGNYVDETYAPITIGGSGIRTPQISDFYGYAVFAIKIASNVFSRAIFTLTEIEGYNESIV